MTADSDLRPSIRIGSVVMATFRYMFSNMGGFIATAWPALLGTAIVDAGVKALAPQGGKFDVIFHMAVPTFFALLLCAPFSAAWIRRVIFGERITGLKALFYDGAVWRTLLVCFEIFGMFATSAMCLWVLYLFSKSIFLIALLIVFPLLCYVYMRFTLAMLMAVVEGRSELKRSWALTRGYMWSISVGVLFIAIASALIIGAPIGVLKGLFKYFGSVGQFAISFFDALIAMTSLALGHTFNVLFFQRRCPPESTMDNPALV